MYSIEFKKSAVKELEKLPKEIIEAIRDAILALQDNPYPVGYKKLKGRKSDYRIRVGSYRIIYQIKNDVLIIYIIKIGHRKDIYE